MATHQSQINLCDHDTRFDRNAGKIKRHDITERYVITLAACNTKK